MVPYRFSNLLAYFFQFYFIILIVCSTDSKLYNLTIHKWGMFAVFLEHLDARMIRIKKTNDYHIKGWFVKKQKITVGKDFFLYICDKNMQNTKNCHICKVIQFTIQSI